ncbi:tyrosine-type recombinase/integrase [bacterium]|nr:tyrosine-type recombinase/integrase [bacterium]
MKEFIAALEQTGDYSSNTIQAYSSDLKRFFAYLENDLGRLPVMADITAEQMRAFLNAENRHGFSASTLHRRKISLTQFAQYLHSRREFSQQQVDEILGWKQGLWEEIYQREILVLTQEEIQRLFAVIRSDQTMKSLRDLAIMRLILETGLSVTETISINLADLDLRSQILKIDNGNGVIRYAINNTVAPLQAYLEKGRPELTQSLNEEALFISQMGGRISRQGIWQLVKEWGGRAELSGSLSPRILRNTAVLRMVVSGYSIPEMQKRLGHSNRFSTRALVRKIKRNLEESGLEV